MWPNPQFLKSLWKASFFCAVLDVAFTKFLHSLIHTLFLGAKSVIAARHSNGLQIRKSYEQAWF